LEDLVAVETLDSKMELHQQKEALTQAVVAEALGESPQLAEWV
jgi:hypothetical protein